MALLNTVLNAVFDLLIQPLRAVHPVAGLLLVSLVMAIVALAAFRWFSNARAIEAVKRRIGAYLLEMRVFRDDLKVLLVDPWKIFALNGKYVAHALVPFLVILPLMALAIIQIESRYSRRSLLPGEATLVTAALKDPAALGTVPLHLECSAGLAVETPGVRAFSRGETTWRLRAVAPGQGWVRISVEGEAPIDKTVWVSATPKALAQARTARFAGLAALAEPAAKPLPRSSSLAELRLDYPEREARPMGLATSVWVFFVLSTVFGFALKDKMGVTL